MFNQMKEMGNIMKKAKQMKSDMKKVQDELKDQKVLGKDKTGTVKVLLTGELECIGVQVTDEWFETSKKEKLQKALQQAFNEAATSAKSTANSKLSKISEGLNIPGLT